MAIQSLRVKFTGFCPLLQNNPQTVDIFNKYAKEKAALTSKRKKTDEDVLEVRRIEIESKVHWKDKVGVIIPSSWIMSSIAKNSFKQAKISKDNARGGIFIVEQYAPLRYDGMEKVKSVKDISGNERFNILMILPQQQVRLAKAFPIFHKWSFEFNVEFDNTILSQDELIKILEYGAKYNGFGDFRPTFGRATIEVAND